MPVLFSGIACSSSSGVTADAAANADARTLADAPDDLAANDDVAVAVIADASPLTDVPLASILPVSYVGLSTAAGAIRVDDIRFAQQLQQVLIPTGAVLQLYDPSTQAVAVVTGFGTTDAGATGSAGLDASAADAGALDTGRSAASGTSSADQGQNLIYAIDKKLVAVDVVDPAAGMIVAQGILASAPDIVRAVPSAQEVWVTQPSDQRIEILSTALATPVHAGFAATPGGPEALVIDASRGHAYTNAATATLVVDIHTRGVVATWNNGCAGARGMTLDESHGILLVACAEGKIVALDLASNGTITSTIDLPSGLDLIEFSTELRHVYAPASGGTLSVVGVSVSGQLTLLGTGGGAPSAHSVAVDQQGHVYLVDGAKSRLAVFTDTYAATN